VTSKLIALMALLLAFAGLGLWGQQQHLAAVKATAKVGSLTTELSGTKTALTRAEKEAKDKAAIGLQRQQRINTLLAQAEAQSKALNEALKENRAWADALVPDSVWDALGASASSGAANPGPSVDRGRAGAKAAGPR
jgi:hypothetical protein